MTTFDVRPIDPFLLEDPTDDEICDMVLQFVQVFRDGQDAGELGSVEIPVDFVQHPPAKRTKTKTTKPKPAPDLEYEAEIDRVLEDAEDWRDYAACLNTDPAVFYCSETDEDQVEYARAFCRACPVALSCLAHAIACREQGIWGGTTETERKGGRTYRPFKECPECHTMHRPDTPAVKYCSDPCRDTAVARRNREQMARTRATAS